MSYGLIIKATGRNCHMVRCGAGQKFLFISDVHFDSTKCDREMLDKHLRQAKQQGAAVFIFGDWFDLMQGKWDPRGNYSDLRPEYKSINYLDAVIDDTIEYLTPYKDIVKFFGLGNHETNISKRMHVSPLDRVVQMLKSRGGETHIGGYSGWLIVQSMRPKGNRTQATSNIHYHHGYGGNAPRSKGVLRVDLDQMQFPDANVMLRGHTHQKWYVPLTVDRVTGAGRQYQETTHHVQMGSYKLLGDRYAGWAVEKGFNTPRLGGWWGSFTVDGNRTGLNWTFTEAQ